jgi:delta-aminolevulinic acid dehydratase/porphobilinogen synthase
VNFHVGNAQAGYQIIVAGHTLDGRIGSIRTILPARPHSTAVPAQSK